MNLFRGLTKGILLKGVFIPKLLNKLLLSWSLISFDIVLSNTLHFYKNIILVFRTYNVWVLLSVFFLHFEQYESITL